jgi:hypothetical protein
LGIVHRLTAKLLLLFALVGNLIPLAMAAAPAAPRACCRRMAHHCHEAAALKSGELVFRDPHCCCNGNCRRAATTAQWAHPKTRSSQACDAVVERLAGNIRSAFSGKQLASSYSSRAPPQLPIA